MSDQRELTEADQASAPCRGSASLWDQFQALPIEQQRRIAKNGFCWIWGRLEGTGLDIEEQFFKRVRFDMTPNDQALRPARAPEEKGNDGK